MKRHSHFVPVMLMTLGYAWLPMTLMAGTTDDTSKDLTPPVAAQTGSSASSWFDNLFDKGSPVHFGLTVSEKYDDNIFIQPEKSNDWVTNIMPSVALTLGQKIDLEPTLDESGGSSSNQSYLSVVYRPNITLYADHSGLDVVDEFADATYIHQFSKLTLGLEQRYEKLSQPTIQTQSLANGTLVHRDIFTTKAYANYAYSDKLATYGTFSQTVEHYLSPNYADTNEWVADYYFLYQVLPKVRLGFGPRIGFVDIEGAPNQTYQSGLVHLDYTATEKLTFILAAGAEYRQYQTGAADRVTPVFEASAIYHPFDSTTVTLGASRHVSASNAQVGQDFTASLVQLNGRQRFFQVLYFNLGFGYENDSYNLASSGQIGAARSDDYYFVKTGFDWQPNDWLTVGTYYQYSEDDSNFQTSSFTDNQYNLSATVKY